MLEFYRAISELCSDNRNIAMTMTDGEDAGEKAVMSDGNLVWRSNEAGCLSHGLPGCDEIGETGIYSTDKGRVFCDVLANEKKVVICGGGHVSIPIIRISRMIGCHVHVLEDRPKFADHARQAGAHEVTCKPFQEGLAEIKGDRDTFFVIVTRGHRYDQICLEAIAKKNHGYIGMIGSRRRVAGVKEAIIERGGDPRVINRIYSPIGLDIGAQTPEEIGVAVMAEIIQVKNRERRSGGYPREILEGILGHEHVPKVLATIIMRKGSAPRQIGAKMVVMPDGSCVGTIGGGCAESGIVREALSMIRRGDKAVRICHVDMTGDDAEEEGMVCGGVIDVMLEWAGK
ncbi:MAG: xanthine dehydrogenase [Hungatella sp.]|nr:xanthine dehydrogenase [Hungatella sp.]